MDEKIEISISKDRPSSMISEASSRLKEALSDINPPFVDRTDMLKLSEYVRNKSGRLKLIYTLYRDARPAKADLTKSPYKEKGIVMSVSANS